MTNGTLTLSNESRKRNIVLAFTSKELHNKNPEDMTDSTIKVMLNKYNKQKEESSSSTEHNKTAEQRTEEEKTRINLLLYKYREKDEESPDTETNSSVNTNDMSGSEEEEIDYTNNQINREDLPYIEFDYKNKDHVHRILEAAKGEIF